ncbi:MAG: hypothetical protein ACI8PZ_007250 [Myxococcota bacterium]|jgi:hypothetical protein
MKWAPLGLLVLGSVGCTGSGLGATDAGTAPGGVLPGPTATATGGGTGGGTGSGGTGGDSGTGAGTGTGSGTGTGTGTTPTMITDTAVVVEFTGSATVTPPASWAGTETFSARGASSGGIVCEHSWTSRNWETEASVSGPDPLAAVPCRDLGGTRCAFAFAVVFTDGAADRGVGCDVFGLTDGGVSGYGYHPDFDAGYGPDGPTFMYYFGTYGQWLPTYDTVSFVVDQLDYAIDIGQLPY